MEARGLKETTKISDIYANPDSFNGRKVKVRGTIVEVYQSGYRAGETVKEAVTEEPTPAKPPEQVSEPAAETPAGGAADRRRLRVGTRSGC